MIGVYSEMMERSLPTICLEKFEKYNRLKSELIKGDNGLYLENKNIGACFRDGHGAMHPPVS